MKKNGRPALPPERRKRNKVTASFSDEEFLTIEVPALETGKRPSEVVRDLVLKGRFCTPPSINRRTAAELGRIGGLLKMLINQVQFGEVKTLSPQDLDLINDLSKQVRALRDELRKEG